MIFGFGFGKAETEIEKMEFGFGQTGTEFRPLAEFRTNISVSFAPYTRVQAWCGIIRFVSFGHKIYNPKFGQNPLRSELDISSYRVLLHKSYLNKLAKIEK